MSLQGRFFEDFQAERTPQRRGAADPNQKVRGSSLGWLVLPSTKALAVDLEVKILAQADPTHPAGRPEEEPGRGAGHDGGEVHSCGATDFPDVRRFVRSGARWAQLAIFTQSGGTLGRVPYLELAQQAEERKKHFDAWLLYGKASEVANGSAGGIWRRRAQAAMAAGLETCGASDAARAVKLGDAGHDRRSLHWRPLGAIKTLRQQRWKARSC
ncbi:unnamed protein product [Durusdinium trenchii]|uniref:Uncharacterized protein n=1 Tax=Durusdinium trenchii TaxID=1381693 RepID=A0ABP0KFZ3_9DINO